MCSEINDELLQYMGQHIILSNKKANKRIVEKVFSQLTQPAIKHVPRTRSALVRNSYKRSPFEFSSWNNLRQIHKLVWNELKKGKENSSSLILKRLKNCLNRNNFNNVPIVDLKKDPGSEEANDRSTVVQDCPNEQSINESTLCNQENSVSTNNKVPIVYLKDVLTTQGRTSKSEFFRYFGLSDETTNCENHPDLYSSNKFTVTKFSQAVNIPISSDLGLKLALKENYLSEEFKIRKIERYEWYVNRLHHQKKESDADSSSEITNHKLWSEERNKFFISVTKPVCVVMENLDLLKIQMSSSKLKVKPDLKKNSKDVRVKIRVDEKAIVDRQLEKINEKNSFMSNFACVSK